MKVNTGDSLALSVQGCLKPLICGWLGPLEGLYFRWYSKHIWFVNSYTPVSTISGQDCV